MTFHLKCARCSEQNECDESIFEKQLVCGVCGSPLAWQHFPQLVELKSQRDEEQREERAKRKQARQEEKERQRAEREARRAEKKAQREQQQIAWSHETMMRDLARRQTEAQEAEERKVHLLHGAGCPRCGSLKMRQKKRTTGAGWGLFFGGVVLAFFTCGAGLVLCIIAIFLNERVAVCNDCHWSWRP